MENLKVKIEKEIPMEVLENVFVTALEGGSNYWCSISRDTYKAIKRTVTDESLSISLFKCVCEHGMVIPIMDVEEEDEDEVLGHLNFSKFAERIEKMYKDGVGWAIDLELDESGDANSSDVVFQYLVMGDLVYG